MRALVKVNLGFVEENCGSLLGSVTMVMTFAVVSIATLLIFMGVMTWFLTRQICPALQTVVAQANAIALGDLTHRLDRQHIGQDETGDAGQRLPQDAGQPAWAHRGGGRAVTQLGPPSRR